MGARDDPESPSVIFSKEDIRVACSSIPPPVHDVTHEICAPIAPPAGILCPLAPAPELVHDKISQPSGSSTCSTWWNIWFHIDRAEGIRRRGWICSRRSHASVSVRFDQQEVHKTATQK